MSVFSQNTLIFAPKRRKIHSKRFKFLNFLGAIKFTEYLALPDTLARVVCYPVALPQLLPPSWILTENSHSTSSADVSVSSNINFTLTGNLYLVFIISLLFINTSKYIQSISSYSHSLSIFLFFF